MYWEWKKSEFLGKISILFLEKYVRYEAIGRSWHIPLCCQLKLALFFYFLFFLLLNFILQYIDLYFLGFLLNLLTLSSSDGPKSLFFLKLHFLLLFQLINHFWTTSIMRMQRCIGLKISFFAMNTRKVSFLSRQWNLNFRIKRIEFFSLFNILFCKIIFAFSYAI